MKPSIHECLGRSGTGQFGRLFIVGALVALYAGGSVYVNLVYAADAVYTHFAYIPVVLACLWWGRRGVAVAVALGVLILSFHPLGIAASSAWRDAARAVFTVVVGICVAALSEKVAKGQRAVALSEERHKLIVEKSLTGILVYRYQDFCITFANTRLGDMLRRRPEEFVAKSVWELISPEDQPRVRGLVAEREAKGFADLHYECRLVRADGSTLWADMLSSVAQYAGARAVLVNAYDITARKEAEAKRRELAELARRQEDQLVHSTRLAELGEMAAAVAHDLNQPLTGIRNFARNALFMVEQGAGTPEEVKDNLRLITEQVDRAARIINQMRGMTRKSERHFALLDLNSIVRESVEFLMPQLRLTGVETSLELAPDLPGVLGDKTRLEQVFLNLLTNARQAMEEAETRRLTVRTSLADGGNRPVVVEVNDTGKGFSAEEAAKLFTPFYSTKKHGHGTGLGLTISQRIVKDHGGVIGAEGEPGKGARFTIRLPLPKPEEMRAATEHP
ncbi:MAG: PAS domain S-box protein [Planctomycetes bacterium]|nr:PAS domain S-box protein [Planctomycetota bacterium]